MIESVAQAAELEQAEASSADLEAAASKATRAGGRALLQRMQEDVNVLLDFAANQGKESAQRFRAAFPDFPGDVEGVPSDVGAFVKLKAWTAADEETYANFVGPCTLR